MAQLKDTLIQGSARVTDTLYGSTVELTSLVVPNADASSTYSAGSAGQVLTSNGSSVYWSSLGGAASYSVTDSSSASAIGTGTALVTERDVYYGLPTINNAHNYTSSTTIYAPTAGGTANYVLMGNGATAAPIWKTPKDALTVMINALDTGPSVLTSNDYIITQYVGGGTSNTTYYRRPASAVRVGGLLTARKLKVALGSTNDATFDGTADQTSIPVSGVLDIAHGGTGATTAAGIREALNLSSAMRFIGTTTTTMSDGLTTADITVNGDTHTPTAGDVVLYSDTEYVWTGSAWERLGRDSSFKITQTAISKPPAVTNHWVSAIGQDANGVIDASYTTLDTSGTWSGLAAKATGVVDAGNSSRVLTIRYGGNGANATDWIPMYDSSGNLIPVSSTNLANKVRDKASGSWNINAATTTAANLTTTANAFAIFNDTTGTFSSTNLRYWQNTANAGKTYIGWVKFASIDIGANNYWGDKIYDIFLDRTYNSPSSEVYSIRVSAGWTNSNIIQLSGHAGNQIMTKFRIVRNHNTHKAYFEYYVNPSYNTYSNTVNIKILCYYGAAITLMNEVQTEDDTDFAYKEEINLVNGMVSNRKILIEHVKDNSKEVHITYGSAIDFWLGIGNANVNHGIYDGKKSDWVLFAGSDNVWHLKGSADKLTDTVKLKVALGSTTDISFDGSADCLNIPISGTLQVPHGGTGATSFVSGNLLVGNGQNALTTIVKTSTNTANTVVERDANGNFSAGTITATLNGKIGTQSVGERDQPIFLEQGVPTAISAVLKTSVYDSDTSNDVSSYDLDERLAYYSYNGIKPAKSVYTDGYHFSVGTRLSDDYDVFVDGTTYSDTIRTQKIIVGSSAELDGYITTDHDLNIGQTFIAGAERRSSQKGNNAPNIIQGHLIISPSYDSSENYNQGIRINASKTSNGWSGIALGGEDGSTTGTNSRTWWIGANTTSASNSNLYIALNGSSTTASACIVGKNGSFGIFPKLGIGIDVPSNGTVFEATGNGRFSTTGSGDIGIELYRSSGASFKFLNSSNALSIQDNQVTSGMYSTTVAISSGTGNIQVQLGTVTINNTTASTTKATGAITIAGGAGIGGQVNAETFRINEQARFEYNSTDDSIDLIWG